MNTKVYIAAAYPTRHQAQILMETLEAGDYEVTSTWLRKADGLNDQDARVDLADVRRADILLAINPVEWKDKGTGGRHVEFGYAVALGKMIILAGAQTNIFHYLSTVRVCAFEDILSVLNRAVCDLPPLTKAADQAAILVEVAEELRRAESKHAPMNSPHEGHSVIREELDELWDHVKADTGRTPHARHEAIQVAAMGARYALNLTR